MGEVTFGFAGLGATLRAWGAVGVALAALGTLGCGADDGVEQSQAGSALGGPAVLQAPPIPEYNVPIRWCVVGNDVNGNGVFDPGVAGENQGAPAWYAPANVGDASTDEVLWRRHERPTDNIYNVQGLGLSLRSALMAPFFDDPTRNFPVIADPNPPAAFGGTGPGEYGDVLARSTGIRTEVNRLVNRCMCEWQCILSTACDCKNQAPPDTDPDTQARTTSDVGVLGVVVRRITDAAGVEGAQGFSLGYSNRAFVVRDNAFDFPGSPLNVAGMTDDAIDITSAHEIGHAWLTPANLSPNGQVGLYHTGTDASCAAANDNLMQTSGRDNSGDGVLDNITLGAVEQMVGNFAGCESVNQIDLMRGGAPTIPGCTNPATGAPCSSFSDLRVDEVEDVSVPALDISAVYFTEPDGTDTTVLATEPFGLFEASSFISRELDYYWLVDLDGNRQTGGFPAVLGIPTFFAGAELVVHAVVTNTGNPEAPTVTARVWVFGGGTFNRVFDPRIASRLHVFSYLEHDGNGEHQLVVGPERVEVEIPNDVRGARVDHMQIQAITRGGRRVHHGRFGHRERHHDLVVIDRLDESRGEGGTRISMTPPTYPLCSVAPNPVLVNGTAVVTATNMFPNEGVRLLLGPEEIARGMADSEGTAIINLPMPFGVRGGPRLITIGTLGTAVTADCTLHIDVPPECENDVTPPVFTRVPRAIRVERCITPNIGQAKAEDACGVRVTNDAPRRFPPGRTIVTWTAEDPSGNVTTATQAVFAQCGRHGRPRGW